MGKKSKTDFLSDSEGERGDNLGGGEGEKERGEEEEVGGEMGGGGAGGEIILDVTNRNVMNVDGGIAGMSSASVDDVSYFLKLFICLELDFFVLYLIYLRDIYNRSIIFSIFYLYRMIFLLTSSFLSCLVFFLKVISSPMMDMEKDFSLDLPKFLKKKIVRTSRKPTDTKCVVAVDSVDGMSQFRQVRRGFFFSFLFFFSFFLFLIFFLSDF